MTTRCGEALVSSWKATHTSGWVHHPGPLGRAVGGDRRLTVLKPGPIPPVQHRPSRVVSQPRHRYKRTALTRRSPRLFPPFSHLSASLKLASAYKSLYKPPKIRRGLARGAQRPWFKCVPMSPVYVVLSGDSRARRACL